MKDREKTVENKLKRWNGGGWAEKQNRLHERRKTKKEYDSATERTG